MDEGQSAFGEIENLISRASAPSSEVSGYGRAELAHADLSPVLDCLALARAATHQAHALACRRRRAHIPVADDPVSAVQRRALDRTVLTTEHLAEESEWALREIRAIPPTLLTVL